MDDKTFELLEKMYSEFLSFKGDMIGFKDKSEKFQDEMTSFKDEMIGFKKQSEKFQDDMTDFKIEMTDFKNDMMKFKDDTNSKLAKIQITQENMEKDIKLIAEVQGSHMEQNERQHKEMMDTVGDKIEVMEAAIRHISGQTTMNTAEVEILKKKLA